MRPLECAVSQGSFENKRLVTQERCFEVEDMSLWGFWEEKGGPMEMDELNQKQLVTATDVLKKNVFFFTTLAAYNHQESLREFFAQTSCWINTAASVKTNEL